MLEHPLLATRSLRLGGRLVPVVLASVRLWRVAALVLIAFGAWRLPNALAAETSPDDEGFRGKLTSLAERCESLGLSREAKITREWLVTCKPGTQCFFLVAQSDPTQPAAGAPKVVQQWHAKFMEHRRAYAAELWQCALTDLDNDRPDRSFRGVFAVLRHDPDHAEARRTLGYRREDDRWQLPQRIRTLSGRATHPTFHWRRNEYLRAESAHFRITTDAGTEHALALATRLEEILDVWRQLFFSVWSSREQLRGVMLGTRQFPQRTTRHEVVLFANREEYLEQLRPIEPQIEVSTGYYHKTTRTAYFYVGDDASVSSQYHEATHQLFCESPGAATDPGERSDFWIVEAMPLYMESLQRHDGYYTSGGHDAERLRIARSRRLDDNVYMPLAELATLGREALQKHPDLRPIYTEVAGLAHFLMDGQQGRLRQATIDYARGVNSATARPQSLAQLTGHSYEELDSLYVEYLKSTD